MIPFFEFSTINFGLVTIQVWGLCVASGIVLAIIFSYYFSKKLSLSAELVFDISIWVLIGAFVMARVFHVVLYEPAYFFANPAEIIKLWHGGASSLGGFVGAAVALWFFAKKRKLSLKTLLPYFDIYAVGLWLGWGVGRIGCFLIHDHPGTLSNFILAVRYPGGARFDLGLLESILGFFLFIIFYLLFNKLTKVRSGLVVGLSVGIYAIARFFFDFLRISESISSGDARYGHLTPAQWGMMAVLITLTFIGLWLKIKPQRA